MTRNEFTAICAERTIDPELALECEAVVDALEQGADCAELATILDEEF